MRKAGCCGRFAFAELGGSLYPYPVGLVIGTRPEAIKMAPVAHALAAVGARVSLILTGQHPGLDPMDHELGGFSALRLDIAGLPDPYDHAAEVADALIALWRHAPPMLVLVQGDTSSALGGARAAAASRIPLGHVEAGLRTHDPELPWPEEGFRTEIDRLSDLLYAPTVQAAANLMAEDGAGEIEVTGNSGIDALMTALASRPMVRRQRRAANSPLRLLVTAHRRESWGVGLAGIASAIADLAARGLVRAEVVLHPNPRVAHAMAEMLAGVAGVRLLPPLTHGAMLDAMRGADLMLSDSGGVQEEAPALGLPLLVLRDKTERPEGIASGNMQLVGTDPARIVAEVERLVFDRKALAAMAHVALPFGDGRAAPRIAAHALDWLANRDRARIPA